MTEYEQVMRKIRAVQTDGKGEMGFRVDEKPAPRRPLAKRRVLVTK